MDSDTLTVQKKVTWLWANKGTSILRAKLNIKWVKDHGTDEASAPWYSLEPLYGEKEGARINDHHVSLADRQTVRESAGE